MDTVKVYLSKECNLYHVKGVSLDVTESAGLYLYRLLNQKCVFTLAETYRGIEKEPKNEVGLSGQNR